MSPEIVAKKIYNGPGADVWATGVVMYAVLTGTLPFKASDKKTLFRKIFQILSLKNWTLHCVSQCGVLLSTVLL